MNALPALLASDLITADVATHTQQKIYAVPRGIVNPEGVGVLLDKIVFDVSFSNGGALTPVDLSVSVKQDNEPITNGFVPLPAVCYPRNRLYERDGLWTLHLARPIYLAPKAHLDLAVKADFQATLASPFKFQATGVGRQVAAPPAERWLPYLTAYRGPVVDFSQAAGTPFSDRSAQNDLGNPFRYPISVERLIGMVMDGAADDLRSGDPDAGWRFFGLRIADQHEQYWVPTLTSPLGVFDQTERSWPVGISLGPNEGITLDVEGETDGNAAFRQLLVGMVAYRRIY